MPSTAAGAAVVKPLKITAQQDDQGARVAFAGELDIGSAQDAEDALRTAEDGSRLTIDLRELTFMDSTGLRLLVAADRRAQEDGRELRIVRGPAAVQRILDLTGLADKLPLVDE